ncbi:MAG: glutamate-cysteine ligase family protein, partial [Patescibacteria group bacterium]
MMLTKHSLWNDDLTTQTDITLISSGADLYKVQPETFGVTMGGELEGQLYREVDGEFVPADLTQELLDELNEARPGCFTPDLFGHMLEVVHSGPVNTLKAYALGMVESLLLLRRVLDDRGLHYIVDGLPPFTTEPQINYKGPIGAYLQEKIRHLFGPIGVQLWMVCGAHFHTGLPKGEGGFSDGDASLWLHRHMARPLDHLLRVLTNNAPFCLGRMTGYMSARGERRRVLNDSGVAQTLPASFEAYIQHLNREKLDRMILGDRDHRTTLRPSKNSGTIEWTMCDNGHILSMLSVLELVRRVGQRLLAEYYRSGSTTPVELFGVSDAHDTRHNAYHVDRFGLLTDVRLLGGERRRERVTNVLKMLVDFADWLGEAA